MKLTAALALGLAAMTATAMADKTIVVASEARRDAVDRAILDATTRGVRTVAPGTTVADASLADSAFIVGCDPTAPACQDEVAAQLGVDRMVIVSRRDSAVEVTVRQRGGEARSRRYMISGPNDAGLAVLEREVPDLIDPARVAPPDPDPAPAPPGDGPSVEPGPRGVGSGTPRGAVILAIGSGVLVAGGLTMWALASAKQGEIDDAPTATFDDLAHLADLERDGRRYAAAGNGLVIAGVVGAAAAGTWIWLARRREPGVRATPVVAPGTVALTVEASW